jgi:cytochrome P450
MPETSSLRPSLPPGPPRSLRQWLTWITRPLDFLDEMGRRYGHTFALPDMLGRPPMIWVADPDLIREVFAGEPDDLHAGEANFIVEGILGSRSLLVLDGEEHRRERRLMMPPFHGERMRAYGHTMRGIADAAIDRWPLGSALSLLPEMQAITLDVILRTVFGLDEGPRLERLRELLRELLRRASHPLLFALSIAIGPVRLREWIAKGTRPLALFGGRWTLSLAPLVPGHGLYDLLGAVDEALYAEIDRRRAQARDPRRDDVLSMLLEARDDLGRPMTDAQLRDEMMTLLLAGHETTAISLGWALHHLVANPEAMARLCAELAPLGRGGPLEPEAVAALEYLDAVVKETMRLTPVVPLVGRVLKRPLTLGGWQLPSGVMVAPNIYLTHHRADLWPAPERFRPERFLERAPAPWEFFPFGGGVRRCLGAAFATYEMKIVIAEVVTRVSLEEAAPVELERRGIMFAPSGGTRVVVRARA